jgi:hypothetical protein
MPLILKYMGKQFGIRQISLLGLLVASLLSCGVARQSDRNSTASSVRQADKAKVLYVDSYSRDYLWSNSIMDGVVSSLGFDTDENGYPAAGTGAVQLRILHMDTKRNQTEEFKVMAASKVQNEIESWQPDLVICSDDNAAKYLIAPHYIGSEIPFVFCGINHDASEYGFPAENITGILEIHNAVSLVGILKEYTDGNRIAYLAGDNLSGRKIGFSVQEQLNREVNQVYVNSYSEWKEMYIDLQDKADILLLEPVHYLPDWDGNLKAMERFVSNSTRIPTGSWDNNLSTITLVTMERTGEEQGEWAGQTALKILNNEARINEIPIARGKRTAVYLNMKLARDLGIRFPTDLIEIAHLTNKLDAIRKVLFVNSYHKGYIWSDDIEKGFLKAIDRSDLKIDLKIFRMDTKRYDTEDLIQKKALEVKDLIDTWDPEVVIGSDDNFSKYVIVPYYKNSETPFIFCGINWNASDYGFPCSNVTGMLEVDPVGEAIELLTTFSRGNRTGFLGHDTFYIKRIMEPSGEQPGISFDRTVFVEDFDSWKREYKQMQKEVDVLMLSSPFGLKGFNEQEAVSFVHDNTDIPTGVTVDGEVQYALLGISKIAEEQGWWAGNTALEVLSGRNVSEIPVTANSRIKYQLNMDLANKMGIVFPQHLLESAVLWKGEED